MSDSLDERRGMSTTDLGSWTLAPPAGLAWATEPCQEVGCSGLLTLTINHELQGTFIFHGEERDGAIFAPGIWPAVMVACRLRAWLEEIHQGDELSQPVDGD